MDNDKPTKKRTGFYKVVFVILLISLVIMSWLAVRNAQPVNCELGSLKTRGNKEYCEVMIGIDQ